MSTYVIGDVQGCYDEYCELLECIEFDACADRVIFAGDIVNRGPRSLQMLRAARDLGDAAVTVLGNHDLHLLAANAGVRTPKSRDTLQPILDAPDCPALIDWLRRCPLAYRDEDHGVLVVHAGLPPQWTVEEALERALELEGALQSDTYTDFLKNMYGDKPRRWRTTLEGDNRLRYITNAFTRTRYVDEKGRLDMEHAGTPGTQPAEFVPWYAAPNRASIGQPVAFGHWATLENSTSLDSAYGVYHLDTGCVWGGRLTGIRLDDKQRFSVASRQPKLR